MLRSLGLGCVLFLWSLLGAAAAIAATAGAYLLVSGLRRRRRIRAVIGGVLAAGGAVVVVVSIVFVASWLILGNRPYSSTSLDTFRHEFGVTPQDVTAFESESYGSTDSVTRFFRFRSPARTVDAIVRGRRFQPVPPAECESRFRGERERRPRWWPPALSAGSTCYHAEPFDDAFATTSAWLAYDPRTGYAHYYYVGID